MGKPGPKPKRREVVWSPELAYAVGLITADGCLSGDGRHLDFTSNDKDQVETLMRCLDIGHVKIGLKNKNSPNPAYRVQWGDVTLYRFFLELGLTPNKSKTIKNLKIPDDHFFDFLRGSFDGDGSFYSYYDPRWKSSFMYYLNFTSASPPHIEWLRETLERLLGVRGHISKTKKNKKRSGVWTLRYAKAETLPILRRMYGNRSCGHLARKRLKIQKALRIVGQSLSGP